MVQLNREQLKEKIEELEFWPELSSQLDFYLKDFLYNKDIEMITILLKAGASPNPKEDLDCWLHHFYEEYMTNKTLHGELILKIVELLLIHGANPNRLWSNNLRAYDFAIHWGIKPFTALLEKHGVDLELRESI
jgi:ankyrin repeat protein